MKTIEFAYKVVKDRLESGAWHHGQRLPSLSVLAELCSVSRSTMWRALKALQKDSLVQVFPRGKIFAGRAGISKPVISRRLIWERAKAQLGQDILAGAFAGNQLSAISKLAIRYNIAIPTIKKVIEKLVDEGLLTTQGSRYSITRSQPRRFSTLVFISAGGAHGSILSTDDNRFPQLIESFERTCHELGFEYRPVGFGEYFSNALIETCATIKNIPNKAGLIVNLWTPWDDPVRKRWIDLFEYLAKLKLPVIIIDQSGNYSLPASLSSLPYFRILRIAGEKAGEIVADFLLRRGYRHVAYATPNFHTHWAQSRYSGLCRYCKQYGSDKTKVELFSLDEIANLTELVLELLDLDRDHIKSLFKARYPGDAMAEFLGIFDRSQKRKLLNINSKDPKVKTIRSNAMHLSELARQSPDPEMFEKLVESLYDKASSYAFENYLKPFFTRVLKHSAAEAWVCSDFKTASVALAFLHEHNKNVPGDVSVIGFDNWRSDFGAGMSSFDFNMNGMVRQAIHMILDQKIFKSKPAISEVDGYVVERRTTRR